MLRPVHFEIHTSDPATARAFYESVLGWTFQQWGDNPYWLIMTTNEPPTQSGVPSTPGINGGMLPRQGPLPTNGQPVNAWVVTVDVPDCSAYVKKALDAGGSTAVEQMAMPGVGYLAYLKDPDGNIFGLMQSDENAQ